MSLIKNSWLTKLVTLSLLIIGGVQAAPFASVHSSGKPATAYLPADTTYNPAVPAPEAFLGQQVGSWHVRHDQLVAYMYKLAETSPRVTITETGRTHEQRPLLLLTITAENNQSRVAGWREDHLQALESGAKPAADAPLFLYMGYSVHGNEASGANASLLIAYYLAAGQSAELDKLLQENVVLLDPSLNPDGLSRFAQWANMHKGQQLVSDPEHREHQEGWPNGRTNHYWFDLNRDWLLLTHPESRARIAQFHQWRPHVLTDFHEMGTNSTYFFQPGVPSRKNPNTPEGNVTLTNALGEFHAAAFDAQKQLYFSQEDFDDFYYGKGSTYPDALGSIGILFEQASSRGHVQDSVNGVLTFSAAIQNQVTTSLSTFAGSLANKPALLDYQVQFHQQTQQAISDDEVYGFVISEAADPERLVAITKILDQHRIEYTGLEKSVQFDEQSFATESSIFVPLEQPGYRLIKSLFSTQQRFANNTFYDVSNWNLPYAFDVAWAEVPKSKRRQVKTTPFVLASPTPKALDSNAYAFAFEWRHYSSPALLQHLMQAGVHTRALGKAVRAKTAAGEQDFAAGTIIIPNDQRQPANLADALTHASMQSGVPVFALTSGLTPQGVDLGSRTAVTLKTPQVMLVGGSGVNPYEAGEVWHYLDTRVGMPVSIIEHWRLNQTRLENYTHIIMVNGIHRLLDEATTKAIEEWVKQGGVLIGQKSAVRLFAQQKWLDADIVARERIDAAFDEQGLTFADQDALYAKKLIAGAVYQSKIDRSHPLFFGFQRDELAFFKTNNMILNSDASPFDVPARYTQDPLLAGYSADELAHMIKSTPAVMASKFGRGAVIGFTDNIHFRGYWYGTNKLMSNALFFSPLL